MSLPKIDPTSTKSWSDLSRHFDSIKNQKMQDWFVSDPKRAEKMAVSWNEFYLDYSKNRVSEETLNLLLNLADEVGLKDAIEAQFTGKEINETEGRAVLHTALRDFRNMKPEVNASLQKIRSFSNRLISGEWKGATGKSITDVVNVGIGGSDLGPDMVCEALKFYKNHLNVHFISNVDGDHVMETIKDLDRETTLFVVVSKTFTTQETLTNAQTIRRWFLEERDETDIARHFVAVSTNLEDVAAFGIASENIFPMWNWVGGRFSLWSAVGLSIACAVGYENFEKLLRGAHEMDLHFRESAVSENIPVILAMLSIWYNNFFGAESECIVPYSQYLNKLVAYLQQGIMESNGKSTDRNGNAVNYQTGTIVWGSTGTNAQHAFFQLIHQGTKLIPTDFICFSEALHKQTDHQNKLMANCFAQTEALLQGTYGSEAENSYKVFEGNKPTNTLLIEKLSPENLGSLIAMYEHKLFVQGVVWNIFSYDQWGVELGKKLAKNTLGAIESGSPDMANNSSTRSLIKKTI
ncbi:glucose-6-phosphate isomerase [Aureitalea sp. L0-47]|uniref:glucose-6-phosphate isomerase n=1 Tax=Aureitalea sp. L0-47 TaxID=2816962 RepID=UPI0022387EED|nr:glucose-6-phosphate isomerase [Aureitalea sp. L0-47]MCW5520593.1 glucose-6-phosphate isomerase [Aureitalea sp. L0-47]